MRTLPIDISDRALAERVVEIQRAAYAVEARLMDFDGIPPLHEEINDVQRHDALSWWGAFADSELVGIIAWHDHGDSLEIDRLAIDPSRARQGFGRQLLHTLPDAHVIDVSTGSANHPAIALYQSEGFELIGTTEVADGKFTSQFRRAPRVARDQRR